MLFDKNRKMIKFIEEYYTSKFNTRVTIKRSSGRSYYSEVRGEKVIGIDTEQIQKQAGIILYNINVVHKKMYNPEKLFYTMLSHEIGHANNTDFDLLRNIRYNYCDSMAEIYNILEDNRIERIERNWNVKANFAALRFIMHDLTHKNINLLEYINNPFRSKEQSITTLLLQLLRTYNRKYFVGRFLKDANNARIVELVEEILELSDEFETLGNQDKKRMEAIIIDIEKKAAEIYNQVKKDADEKLEKQRQEFEKKENKQISKDTGDEQEDSDEQGDNDTGDEQEGSDEQDDNEQNNKQNKQSTLSDEDIEAAINEMLENLGKDQEFSDEELEAQIETFASEEEQKEMECADYELLINPDKDIEEYKKYKVGLLDIKRRAGIGTVGTKKSVYGKTREFNMKRYASRKHTSETEFFDRTNQKTRGVKDGKPKLLFYLDISGSMESRIYSMKESRYVGTRLRVMLDYVRNFYDTLHKDIDIRIFLFSSKTYQVTRNELNEQFLGKSSAMAGTYPTFTQLLPNEKMIMLTDGDFLVRDSFFLTEPQIIIIGKSYYNIMKKRGHKNLTVVEEDEIEKGLDKATMIIKNELRRL